MIVSTRNVETQTARWFHLEAVWGGLVLTLHYTHKENGCYLIERVGFAETLGM